MKGSQNEKGHLVGFPFFQFLVPMGRTSVGLSQAQRGKFHPGDDSPGAFRVLPHSTRPTERRPEIMTKPRSKSLKIDDTILDHAKMSWLEANGKIYCFVDPADLCVIIRFAELKSLTPFHDAELARCTKEINAIGVRDV